MLKTLYNSTSGGRLVTSTAKEMGCSLRRSIVLDGILQVLLTKIRLAQFTNPFRLCLLENCSFCDLKLLFMDSDHLRCKGWEPPFQASRWLQRAWKIHTRDLGPRQKFISLANPFRYGSIADVVLVAKASFGSSSTESQQSR
jgi:hypothetical protein